MYLRNHTAAVLCALSCLLWSLSAYPQDCVNADPYGVLTNIIGDFELIIDPQDPQNHILYTSNSAFGTPARTVVAQLDPVSGFALSLSVVATNAFTDNAWTANGPEWFVKPDGQLGLVYPGLNSQGWVDGVHMVFRSQAPAAWDQFVFDINNARVPAGLPPAISDTIPGASSGMGPFMSLTTLRQWSGSCKSDCYGSIYGGTLTDIGPALADLGLEYSSSALNPNRDGYLLFSACDGSQSCGIYEAAIDKAGGFLAGSVQKLHATDVNAPHFAAGVHPVTGDTVVFSDVVNKKSARINVWQQPAAGGPLNLVGYASAFPALRHFSTQPDPSRLVLIYEIDANTPQSGRDPGTYTLAVAADHENTLVVGQTKKVSESNFGEEVIWMPAINRWALFNRKNDQGGLFRCWIHP